MYLIEEHDCLVAESIDIPKVLGDLFESLIAAIYLDCNRNLNFVWKICYSLMENEISKLQKCIIVFMLKYGKKKIYFFCIKYFLHLCTIHCIFYFKCSFMLLYNIN